MTAPAQTGLAVELPASNLARVVSLVSRAASGKTLPITSNVLIATDRGRIKVACTDLELSIQAWCGARIDAEGATTVSAKMIGDLLGTFPDATLLLTLDERKLRWECARGKGDLATQDAEDFPILPSFTGASFEIPARMLERAFKHTAFAAATNDSRPVLSGIQIESKGGWLTFAAADGFRLSVFKVPTEAEPFSVILPRKTAVEVERICAGSTENVTVTLSETQKQIAFRLTDIDISASLIEGTFPNFTQLIPQYFNTKVTVDSKDWLAAAKRSAIYARDRELPVIRHTFTKGIPPQMRVWGTSDVQGEGDGTIDVEMEGDDTKIGLDSRYLADCLAVIDGKVEVQLTSPSSPAAFREVDDPNYVHVVMPMFLNDWAK